MFLSAWPYPAVITEMALTVHGSAETVALAIDSTAVFICDPDIKQAAAVTLKVSQSLQGVTWVFNLGHKATVNNCVSLPFSPWQFSPGCD